MSEPETITFEQENITLHYLRRIDDKLDGIRADLHDLKARVSALEVAIGLTVGPLNQRIDRIDARIDRIERRFAEGFENWK